MSGFGILGTTKPSVDDIADVLEAGAGTADLARVQSASAEAKKVLRLGIIGDSFSAPDTPTAFDSGKWWVHALAELGWPYQVVAVSAVGGRTVEDMNAAFSTEMAPFLPQVLWILPGRNNASGAGGTTAASGLTALNSLITQANSAGCRNIWVGTPCQGSNDTLATREGLLVFAAGVKALSDSGKVTTIDTASVYRDPTSLTGSALPAVLRDPVADRLHPGAIGARRLGKLWAETVRGRVTVEASRAGDLVNGPTDSYLVTTRSNRVAQNPCLLGTAGTKAGAGVITGTVPDAWTLNCVAGITTTTQQYQTATNGKQLNWFSQSLSGTLASAGGTTLMQFLPMATLGLVVGSKVRLRVVVKVSGLSPTFKGLQFFANWFTAGYAASGSTSTGFDGVGQYGAGELTSGVELIFETPVSPALTGSTQLQINVSSAFSAGVVAGVIDITSITCEVVL